MEIDSIVIENWGPYLGRQVIDLSVTRSAPVVVVHGENDRGKTSFLRAIYFGLYGEVKDKGKNIAVHELVSQRALEGLDEVKFSIEIHFNHEGERFVIERGGSARQEGREIVPVEPLWVEFRTDAGTPFPQAVVKDRINGLLDQDIAVFYLFDGERLDEIIRKLRDRGGLSSDFVKSSVERAVGLSFVAQLIEDLKSIRDDIYGKLQKDKKVTATKERLIQDIERKQQEIDRVGVDESAVVEEKGNHTEVAERTQEQLDQFDEIRDLVVERQTLVKQREEKQELLEQLWEDRRHQASQSWLFPMKAAIESKLEGLNEELHKAAKHDARRQEIEAKILIYSNTASAKHCGYCGSEMSDSDVEKASAKRKELEEELASVPSSAQSVSVLSPEVALWNRFLKDSAGGSGFFSLLERIEDYEKDILEFENQERKLSSRIGKSETPDIVALEDTLKLSEARIRQANELLQTLEAKKKSLGTELATLKAKLRDSPEVSSEIRYEVEVIDDALAVAERAFVTYRERMREAVQSAASEALVQISSEPEFETLRIGEEYQISILNSEGKTQKHSKGYEQISALSFIAGLAQTAGESNFMAMDTPFGRLDEANRKGVLKWAAERQSQTILFVQSGELKEDQARELIGKELGRQLRLKRVRQGSSEIVEVR